MDPDGLYTLGTVVIDYRGYRVTAQSIIPGKYKLVRFKSFVHQNFAIIPSLYMSYEFETLYRVLSQLVLIGKNSFRWKPPITDFPHAL